MSVFEKETEPITSVWKIFDKQRGLSNSVMISAAFANFLHRRSKCDVQLASTGPSRRNRDETAAG